MSLRVKHVLKGAGLPPPPLSIVADTTDSKNQRNVIMAALPAQRLEDARAICGALITQNLACELKLRATTILDAGVRNVAAAPN